MSEHMDGQQLRVVMRQVPSSVTVVTVAGDRDIRGITIGSFTSVSLDPPLISFNVALDAQAHDLLVGAEHFAVHILSDEQAQLSDQFARKDLSGAEQFATVPYRPDANGTPVLEDVLAVFHCVHYAVYPAGDHSLLVGEVCAIDEGVAGLPLVYYDRSYRRVGEEIDVNQSVSVKSVSSDTP